MTIIVLTALFYLVCGVLTYGITFAYHQRSCRYDSVADEQMREVSAMALTFALFGPFGLGLSFLLSGFAKHGLLYRPSRR